MIIRNCDCGKKVDCGCMVSFDSYEANSITVLSVGNLVGGSCTFDAYVIDWYVEGKRKLVSGKGNDPEIQAYHPFEGSAAIPVEGGLWTPVIRYVEITGERIYNGIRKCDYWCDSLEGLPAINVSSIGCGMRNLGTYSLYDYVISYNTSQDYSLASRTIRFDLPSDLSAVYFAFYFYGKDVADQIDIFLNESDQPLTSWIVGTRFVTNWWQSMPYRRSSSTHKVAFALPAYQAGDYLRIRVTPSVLENNPNTDWQLQVKCLDSSYVFACDYVTLARKTISSVEMIHNVENCRYQLNVQLQEPMGIWSQASHPFYWMYQYGGYGGLGHNSSQMDHATGIGAIYLSYSKRAHSVGWTKSGYYQWTNSYGAIHVTKSGNIVTFVFDDNRDYQLYYDNYQSFLGSTLFTDYSPDPLNLKHYRYVHMYNRIAPNGCGDAYVDKSFQYHITSPVVFSGGNTLTIEIQNVVNGYPDEQCNSAYSSIQSQINSIQSSINLTDYSGTTRCRPVDPIGYSYGFDYIINSPYTDVNGGQSIHAYSNLTVPCESMQNFCDWSTPNSFWISTLFYVNVKITATMDANKNFLEDPRDNFEVYSMITEDGCYSNIKQKLLYKKVNGVEVTNILPAY